MHAAYRPAPHRIANYHNPKRQILNNAGNVPPAWRTNHVNPAMVGPHGSRIAQNADQNKGSKILISNLPSDVDDLEVEELFKRTVGPLKEVFVVYNSQAKSKGIAVVSFQRAGDAAVARGKYHNKIVDGKRPIKIEIVVDEEPVARQAPAPAPAPAPPRSLLQRISGANGPAPLVQTAPAAPRVVAPVVAPAAPRQHVVGVRAAGPRLRRKKGPRRVNKVLSQKTVVDLDHEMDEYRAAADAQ